MRRKLALSLIPLLATLAIVELGARLLNMAPVTPPPLTGSPLDAHPTRMWALGEGEFSLEGASYVVGEDGLRTSQITGADIRVLTLGDSSIFGHGVEDAFTLHSSLQEMLKEQGIAADVLCGGVPGYSTLQTQVFLEEQGWALEPDLLVFGSLWSDNHSEYFVDSEWLEELNHPAWKIEFLLNDSHAWRWLRRRISAPGKSHVQVGWIRDPYSTERRRVSLSEYANAVDGIFLSAARLGIGVVVLAPANTERVIEQTVFHPWDPYFEVLEKLAQRRGIPLIDTATLIRNSAKPLEEVFLDSLHPSGSTNRLYASEITAVLREADWPQNRLLPSISEAQFNEPLIDTYEGIDVPPGATPLMGPTGPVRRNPM